MNMLTYMLLIILGIFLYRTYQSYSYRKIINRNIDNVNNQYLSILESLKRNSKFKDRIHNLIYIKTYSELFGEIDIILQLDKKEISIFKNENENNHKCILTSTPYIKPEIINEFYEVIYEKFNSEINDVIEILGNFYYKKNLELFLNKKLYPELQNIKNENILNVDDILDKISKYGIQSITKEEKDFLDNNSK